MNYRAPATPRPPHEDDVLTEALQAHFAAAAVGRASLRFMYASTAPSFALFVHSRFRLPDLLVWFATLAWGGCIFLAVSLAVAAWRWQERERRALPASRRQAAIEFAEDAARPAASPFFAAFSVLAAGILWVHGMAPGWLSVQVVAFGGVAWLSLAIASVALKCFEH